jgi:hypothetical protein
MCLPEGYRQLDSLSYLQVPRPPRPPRNRVFRAGGPPGQPRTTEAQPMLQNSCFRSQFFRHCSIQTVQSASRCLWLLKTNFERLKVLSHSYEAGGIDSISNAMLASRGKRSWCTCLDFLARKLCAEPEKGVFRTILAIERRLVGAKGLENDKLEGLGGWYSG